MKMELAKEIKKQNPWIPLTHQSEEKLQTKRKKKVCVNEKPDGWWIVKHYCCSDPVFSHFDSILTPDSILFSVILKQVWKAHNQIGSFSKTLTEISNQPIRKGRFSSTVREEMRVFGFCLKKRRGDHICLVPSCAKGLMLCLSCRPKSVSGKVNPFVLTGQNVQKSRNLNAFQGVQFLKA